MAAEKRVGHPGLSAPKTLSSELADRLCDRIRNERLVPGTRLGTEAEIGQEYGVSRTVVREAIGCLRGLGVVTGRQRLGLFVAQGDIRGVLEKALSPRAADEEGWQELRQIRVVIELGSLPMAVERATEEQLARLASLAAEMRALMKSYDTDPDRVRVAFDAKDMQFHQAVLEAAHDDLARRFHDVLVQCFRVDDICGALPTLAVVREHERIAKAIAKRDTAAAVQLMTEHLRPLLGASK